MRVDVEDGQWGSTLVGAQDRDGHGVISADAHRNRAAIEDGGDRRRGASGVARTVGGVAGDVAGVDHPWQAHRSILVEVPVIAEPRQPDGTTTDGGRRHGASGGGTGTRIGPAIWHPESDDAGIEPCQVGLDRGPKEAGLGLVHPHLRQPSSALERGGALVAPAYDGDVADVDLEPVDRTEGPDDFAGARLVDLPGGAAVGAVEMAVLALREDVELLAAIGAMSVPDQAELLENVEGAVHGRGNGR